MSIVGEKKYARARLALAPDTDPHSTGIILPIRGIVQDVYAEVITPEATGATKTIDIGVFGGDEDGFLAGLPVSAAGIVNGSLDGVAPTRGALLTERIGSVSRKFAVAPLPIVADTNAHSIAGLPADDMLLVFNTWLIVNVPEETGATKTVSVGVTGAETGLLNAVSVAAEGLIKGTLLNSGQTLGALLSQDESGAGVLVPEPYLAEGITFKYKLGSADFEELDASVVVEYLDMAGARSADVHVCPAESTVVVTYGSDDFEELEADIIVEYLEIAEAE